MDEEPLVSNSELIAFPPPPGVVHNKIKQGQNRFQKKTATKKNKTSLTDKAFQSGGISALGMELVKDDAKVIEYEHDMKSILDVQHSIYQDAGLTGVELWNQLVQFVQDLKRDVEKNLRDVAVPMGDEDAKSINAWARWRRSNLTTKA